MQIITPEFLALGLAKNSHPNEAQLTILSLTSENIENYEVLSLGKELSDASAELFVLLKGIKAKSNQEKIISNYKAILKFRKKPPKASIKETPTKEPATPLCGDVTIYCDGGCSPNPGESGSGIALYRNNHVSALYYGLYEPMGTNNTAELGALYQSLLMAKDEAEAGNSVEIKCDSMYSINCIKTWAIGWEKKGWTKKGGEIKNLAIIQDAYHLYNSIKNKISLSHIKAHAGLEGNELADRMTVYARAMKEPKLVQYNKSIDIQTILNMRSG